MPAIQSVNIFAVLAFLGILVENSQVQNRSPASTWTACDGALWASELCDNGSELPLGIGWESIKADCEAENGDHSWLVRGQACDATPATAEFRQSEQGSIDNDEIPVVLLVDSTFGDVSGLCGCTPQRRGAGLSCTEPAAAPAAASDLRPFDWVVFGLVPRPEFRLRHARCPFVGNETEVTAHAVILTDRELHYALPSGPGKPGGGPAQRENSERCLHCCLALDARRHEGFRVSYSRKGF